MNHAANYLIHAGIGDASVFVGAIWWRLGARLLPATGNAGTYQNSLYSLGQHRFGLGPYPYFDSVSLEITDNISRDASYPVFVTPVIRTGLINIKSGEIHEVLVTRLQSFYNRFHLLRIVTPLGVEVVESQSLRR